ncbi:MAG: hypothetical protein JWN17_1720, partial [Frankiales bacterium]|nr:hypothetical protein [Frankiales bacterium]
MTTTLRRATAVVGLAAATAVVAGVLAAPSASADITKISPNTAFNTEAAKALTFTFGGTTSGTYRFGGTATFVRLSAPSDSFTVTLAQPAPPDLTGKTATGTLDATDADGNGAFASDGPLAKGTYDVKTTSNDLGSAGDACGSCFTVDREGPVALTALSPNAVQAGKTGQLTFTGNNFERGLKIDMLLPGTTTVDSTINANQAPDADGNGTVETDAVTTRTTLKRTVTVAAGSATGARDVRVTLADGTSAVLPKGFSVNGAPLTSTTPAGGNNDPALGASRVTFTGTGLSTTGTPSLQYTGDPGSSTAAALSLAGTVVGTPTSTSYVADFDLRNAAPGPYLPVIRNTDGSSNACSCSFTVAQAPGRPTTVTSVDSDTATAGTQKTQAAGTTKTFVVTGTGFAKGSKVTVSGAGVTTTAVELVSDTVLKATFQSTATAMVGDRNVTVTRTDATSTGATGTCTGCYTVTAAASPTPSASPTTTPTASASPSPTATSGVVAKPTISVSPSTIIAVQQKATVSGVSTPGATIEIHAYSRPSTTFTTVRTGTVGPDGTYSFVVGPSGNTRLFART